jgi:hypothetical protein
VCLINAAQSASYASTSSLMNTATGSGYGSSVSETTAEHRPTASPQSTTSSTTSHAYQSGMASTAMSPNIVGSAAGLGVTSGAYEPHRSATQLVTSMGQWQTPYPSVSGNSQYATGLSGSGRQSWDLNPYMEHGIQGSTAPVSGQHLQYYRDDATASGQIHPSETKPYPTHSQAHS